MCILSSGLVNQAVRSIKLTFNIFFSISFNISPPSFGDIPKEGREKRMLEMMEKKNNDKGKLADRPNSLGLPG